jgi:hypothetical protein
MRGIVDLTENAYREYGRITDFKNFRGEPMPEFKNLPEKIQKAWRSAVAQVILDLRDDLRNDLLTVALKI